jgi:quercetin dioxygenase-like cupin family protein
MVNIADLKLPAGVRLVEVAEPSAIVNFDKDIAWSGAIVGEVQRIRVNSRDVGGRYAMVESIAAPGCGTPRHFHREDEIFQILEGTLTMEYQATLIHATRGTIVVVPAGMHHAWVNRTDKPVRMMITFSPGGVEELFGKLPGLGMDEIIELARSYGSIIVGPPID